jgi:hypothetical protein
MLLLPFLVSWGTVFEEGPVIIVGLPKVATTSIFHFFQCSGYSASHWTCGENGYCGTCIQKNKQNSEPLLSGCGDYDVWAQIDFVGRSGECYFPQISDLALIHDHYPNATWILNMRRVDDWIASVTAFKTGTFAKRLRLCAGNDLERWYWKQIKRVRSFKAAHPTQRIVELNIDAPGAENRLIQEIGGSVGCWKRHNSNPTAYNPDVNSVLVDKVHARRIMHGRVGSGSPRGWP